MAKSCIFKIILGGSSGSGKTTFINGDSICDNDFFHIGVSFKLIECIIEDEDSYLMQIWDLKAVERFQCLFSGFCKGAKGAILTFDLSNHKSFEELEQWITLINNNSLRIPVIIIATKSDLPKAVDESEIIDFMETYQIDGFFQTSSVSEDNRNIILKHLIECICHIKIRKFTMRLPERDEDFRHFWNSFSHCPVCNRENHVNYLKNFFFSNQPQSIVLKEKLIELLEKVEDLEDLYLNQIIFGIPCCKCYEEIFGK